jgi:hypothetical protein
LIKKFIQHIVYTNIIVALSAGVLAYGYSHLVKIDKSVYYGLLTFFSSFAVYNGQRLFKASAFKQTPWLVWVAKNKGWITVIVICSMLAAGINFMFIVNLSNFTGVLLLLTVSMISALYVIRVRGVNLREIPMLKIHLIAFSWTALIVLFPRINEMRLDGIGLDSFAIYLLAVGAAIPFDIRDLKYDLKTQCTIPQMLGIIPSIVLAIVSVLVSYLLLIFVYPDLMNSAVFASYAILVILIVGMNTKRSDVYCAGLIDGALGLIGFSYLLSNAF